MEFGNCPRCKQEVSQERQRLSPIICNHCGFTSTKAEITVMDKVESKFIKTAIGLSVVLAAGFIQVANWDTHAAAVLPLQVKSLIGAMSAEDHDQMASICMDRKKYDCVELSYGKSANASLENRARFASFLFKREKIRASADQYKTYFAQGGVDLEATYEYAKALSQLGQFDEASVLFQQVIDAKPETVQITVLQHYIRALISGNQLEKAKTIIEDVRKQSAQANSFMEPELKQILGQTKTT